jgi:sarcosine oxidase
VTTYDVIVIGIGGMGSASLYHLARRGVRVLGLERFDIPHERGSSHGASRIIRLAYAEHQDYVPLVRRSYELWRELEHAVGERLLIITGGVDLGDEGGKVVKGSLRACADYHLPHETLDAGALRRRFPGFSPSPNMLGVYQPDGGFLLPERCIVAHVVAAQALGAEVHGREQVLGWEASHQDVSVTTDRGTYRGAKVVIAAGPWAAGIVPHLRSLAVAERQVVIWTQPAKPEYFRLGAFPVFNLEAPEGRFYGFPIYGVPGVKVGKYHHRNERVDPDAMSSECYPEDEDVLREGIRLYLPDADGPTMALKTCLFTNSPDEHFMLDFHPDFPRVVIAAGFSGHGFKFCSVVGEIMTQLALDGGTRLNIGMFSINRFAHQV